MNNCCNQNNLFDDKNTNNSPKPKFIFCLGPTGPTGPQGPSTITVGNTTTLPSDAKASVINNGTLNNAILDFSIPKGEKGPTGPTGPQGPKGEQGEQGPESKTPLRSAYLVTFNDHKSEIGQPIQSEEAIPITRVELDVSKIINLDTQNNTIKFNNIGYYKVSFMVSAYAETQTEQYDPNKDFVSIGFKPNNKDEIYIGASQWVYDEVPYQILGQGIIAVNDIDLEYSLVNLSNQTIYLNSPNIKNIKSKSYFTNSIVTIIIDYLGRQGA